MKIQFAADADWPESDEANHATRMEFPWPQLLASAEPSAAFSSALALCSGVNG